MPTRNSKAKIVLTTLKIFIYVNFNPSFNKYILPKQDSIGLTPLLLITCANIKVQSIAHNSCAKFILANCLDLIVLFLKDLALHYLVTRMT